MKPRIGDKFGSLLLIGEAGGRLISSAKAEFLCDCGLKKNIRLAHVTSGVTVSCGCVKRKHKVEVGQVFGRLTVISDKAVHVGRHLKSMCRCECGTEKLIGIPELCTGVTNSCGCLVVEQVTALGYSHGLEQHPAYKVWTGMKERCLNQKSESYHRYGGRGIKICDEWLHDCKAFCDWADTNGHVPGLEIDRRDNDGNYEPRNCRFVTTQVNCRNRRRNVRVSAFGENKIIKEWSEDSRCIVKYEVLRARLKRGVHPELAMTTPVQAGKPLR